MEGARSDRSGPACSSALRPFRADSPDAQAHRDKAASSINPHDYLCDVLSTLLAVQPGRPRYPPVSQPEDGAVKVKTSIEHVTFLNPIPDE